MRAVPKNPEGRQQIDELRRKVRALEARTGESVRPDANRRRTEPGRTSETPVDLSGDRLALAPGLHEVCPAGYLDTPAALAFQTACLSAFIRAHERQRPVLWVRTRETSQQDFGRPYPPGLAQWGIDPGLVVLVESDSETDALWAMEEGVRAGALVMGESGRSPRYDLTASKRLLMTARSREAVILVLRPHEGRTASAALSRWRIAASPSPARAWRGANGLPGLGAPRFDAALERVRGGPPRNFRIEWKNETLHVLEPAPLADRTAPGDDDSLQPAPATGGARIHRLAG